MTLLEAVKYLKGKTFVTYEDLAKLTSKSGAVTFYNGLINSKNPTLKSIVQIVQAFNCKLIIVPKDTEVEGSIVLDGVECGLVAKEKIEACPFCGHSLTKKERAYTHCPHCGKNLDLITNEILADSEVADLDALTDNSGIEEVEDEQEAVEDLDKMLED